MPLGTKTKARFVQRKQGKTAGTAKPGKRREAQPGQPSTTRTRQS